MISFHLGFTGNPGTSELQNKQENVAAEEPASLVAYTYLEKKPALDVQVKGLQTLPPTLS